MCNHIHLYQSIKKGFYLVVIIALSACSPEKVTRTDDVCDIYNKNYDWYRSAIRAQNKYNINASTIMSVMAQESNFKHNARPQKRYAFYVLPWGYETTAQGYAQVINGAWDDYKKANSKWFPSRNNFNDASDFIGWYLKKASRELNINKNDNYHLYLAYHQGIKGYRRHEEKHNKQLDLIAKRVNQQALRYDKEFKHCQTNLWLKHWLYVWDY